MTRTTLSLLLAAVWSVTLALAGSPKIAPDLNELKGDETVDVIVQFKQSPKESHFRRVRQKGGKAHKGLPLVKAGAFSIPADKLDELAADPDVAYISLDRPVAASLDYAVETLGADIALQHGWDGEGVGVAIIDSGTYGHEDLSFPTNQIVYQEGFIRRKVKDEFGHGTHVAGIVAGTGHVAEFLQLHQELSRSSAESPFARPTGTGCKRTRHRQRRDCRYSASH